MKHNHRPSHSSLLTPAGLPSQHLRLALAHVTQWNPGQRAEPMQEASTVYICFNTPKESQNQDLLLGIESSLFSFICNSNFYWFFSLSPPPLPKSSISSHDLIMMFRIIVFSHRSSASKINIFPSTEAAESPKLLYLGSESQAH